MHRFLMFSGLLLVCSCSGDDDEPELTRGDFCADWAEAACSEETVDRCQAADVDACRLSQADYCLALVPQDFDAARSRECLSAVRAAYRDGDLSATELRTVQRLDTPCDRLARGPAGEGDSCDADSDCATPDGFECVRKGGAEMGTCQQAEPAAAGESCAAAQQTCSGNFFCNGANCVAFFALGATCTSNEECGPEARCQGDECTARAGTGADCTEDEDCVSNVCLDFEGGRTCTDRLVLARSEPFCDELR